jgi:hypothetical protein
MLHKATGSKQDLRLLYLYTVFVANALRMTMPSL